jgi:hypothetical protein
MQVRYQAALRPEPLLRLDRSKVAIIAEKRRENDARLWAIIKQRDDFAQFAAQGEDINIRHGRLVGRCR